ncbi:hypothetical protein [Candidatus Hodgkinia cicadicola]
MWGRWYGFHVIYLWVVWFAIKMLWMLLWIRVWRGWMVRVRSS